MIILDSINKSLEVDLLNTVTTNELIWNASWVDLTSSGFVPGSLDGLTTGTVALAMVPAPAASTQRQIKGLSIYNIDTVAATLLVSINNAAAIRTIIKVTLLSGESLIFNGDDFSVHMSDGTIKTGSILTSIATSQLTSGVDVYPVVVAAVNGNNVPMTDLDLRYNLVDKELYTNTLALPAKTTPPATPNTDISVLFARKLAGRNIPAFVGPTGLETTIQSFMGRNKIGYWSSAGNTATAPVVFSLNAFTALGTLTARNVATTNFLTRMRRMAYVSAATAAAMCGVYQASAQFTTGNGIAGNGALGGFFFIVRFTASDAAVVAGARSFVGMTSSVAAPTNVEPSTLTNSIGLAQLSTDATQWYLCYGGSTAQVAIPLGTAIGAPTLVNTCFELILFAPPSGNGVINYMVCNLQTGVQVNGTITPITPGLQTPLNTTLLGIAAWRTNNATALAAALDLISFYIETDN